MRLTKRSNKTVHENGVCCTHFNGKECSERMGECTDNCPWEEAVWSKLADYEDIGTVSEFRQLKEKATAIREKAIEEFAEQIKARAHSTERNDWSADYMISIWESVIDEIAMELKGE